MEKPHMPYKMSKGGLDTIPSIERRNKKNNYAKRVVSKQKMRVNQVLARYKQENLFRNRK